MNNHQYIDVFTLETHGGTTAATTSSGAKVIKNTEERINLKTYNKEGKVVYEKTFDVK